MKPESRLGALVQAVEEIAKDRFDGHYSLFSFTTNYKGCFGTPHDWNVMREALDRLPVHDTLEELLFFMAEAPEKYTIQGDDN